MTRDEIIEKAAKQRCIDNGWTLDRAASDDSCFRHDDMTPWWKARYETQIRREIEALEKCGFIVTEPHHHIGPAATPPTPADEIIGQIEDRFPDWRGFRDLVDCIDVTLRRLRGDN